MLNKFARIISVALAFAASQLKASDIGTIDNPSKISGITILGTNVLNGVTNAGIVTNCAWSATNNVFRQNGGSGLIQNITLISATNRDYTIWIFDKVISAPTAGSAWTPTIAELTFLVWQDSTTNPAYPSWQYAGTNWAKTLKNLSISAQNKDNSRAVHIIATSLDTKSNYNTMSYMQIGSISD